jgi:hypothetical protein
MTDTKKLRELLDIVNATFMVYEKEADFHHGWETKKEATLDLFTDFAESVCNLGAAMITEKKGNTAIPLFGITVQEPATEDDLQKIIMSSGVVNHNLNN